MQGISLCLFVLVSIVACNRRGSQAGADARTSAAPPPIGSTLAPATKGQPTTIVARNATGAELTLDVSFGPASVFQMTDVRGESGGYVLEDPKAHCPCGCKAGLRCPRCEPPAIETVKLASGKEYRFAWSGDVLIPRERTNRPSGEDVDPGCREQMAPPPGRYLFQICNQQRTACGVTTVALPSGAPIVIPIEPDLPPPSCPLEKSTRERAARMALGALAQVPQAKTSLAACDPTGAVCAAKLEPPPAGDRCSIVVVPSGRDLEVHITPKAGKRALAVVDANAVQVRKIDG